MTSGSRSIQVLHVDDDQDIGEVVREFLEREAPHLEVTTVQDASTVLDELGSRPVDCLVSDYDMPGMDGIGLLEAVREEYPALPFILYTGKGSEEVASEAISAGVTDYIRKETGTSHYSVLANRIGNAVARRRARDQASRTEQQLEDIAEHSNDILWMFNADWSELLFINSPYEDIWGRSITELREDPRSFLKGIHPDDRERVQDAMAALSSGEAVDIEYRVNEQEDFGRWVWVQAEAVTDADGAVQRIAGFARDVTARKERELEVERTSKRYEALFQQSNDAIMLIDPFEERILDVNPKACELLGYEREEVLSLSPADLHPTELDRFRAFVDEVYEVGTGWTDELPCATKSGDVIAAEISASRIELETGEHMLAIIRDVTDRKAHERELEQVRDRMEFALQATDAIVWDWDVEADEATFYPSAETLYGTDVETLEDFISVIHPEDREEVQAALQESLETGEPKYEEVRIRRNGDVRWIEAPGRPVEEDGATRMIGVARDVTERKRNQEELKQQNERLEEFARIVSHDLRNPLNVADGHLELAQEECDSEHLASIEHALERSQDLVDGLLALAQEGGRVRDVGPVDLAAAAAESWRNVETAEATLVTETELTVRADESRLQQLLENLFRNADQHGGGDVRITVGDLDEGRGFFVADDGSGIPRAERPQVFDTGYSTEAEGTGFGLSIVEDIATAHGWGVSVGASSDGGARFEVSDVEVVE